MLGTLLVLEGALRLRFYVQHGTFLRIHEFARDEATGLPIPVPGGETNAILIEGEDDIPADEAHFADSVHFTDLGCRAQAERVLHGLESSPAFQALFAR